MKVNKHIQEKVANKASQKTATSKKLKKIRGSKLCSQCSKMNEDLNQNKREEAPEMMETPVIPAGQMSNQ